MCNYYLDIYGNSGRFMVIYEYVNNICIVGLGEFIGIFNGVEFRIRYNDYCFYMVSKISKDYYVIEEILFLEVFFRVKNKFMVDD